MSDSEKALLNACRVLFGPELRINRDFLAYLQLSGMKRAFRQRAKETYPDNQLHSSLQLSADSSPFTEVREAYSALEGYICWRETATQPVSQPATQPHCNGFNSTVGSARMYRADRRQSARNGKFLNPLKRKMARYRFTDPVMPVRRIKLGRYLYHAGVVEWQDVIDALVWQGASRPRFGEHALALGLLTNEQVNRLVVSQQLQQRKIGRFFVVHELLAERELYRQIRNCYIHNSRFPGTT